MVNEARFIITQPGLFIAQFQERQKRWGFSRWVNTHRLVDSTLDGLLLQIAQADARMRESMGLRASRQARRAQGRKWRAAVK